MGHASLHLIPYAASSPSRSVAARTLTFLCCTRSSTKAKRLASCLQDHMRRTDVTAHLSSAATRAYASEVMQVLDFQGRILKKSELRIQLISFIASAVNARVMRRGASADGRISASVTTSGPLSWRKPGRAQMRGGALCCADIPPECVCEEDADDFCGDTDDACEPEIADDEDEALVAEQRRGQQRSLLSHRPPS